jgi:hypothetical protein
VHSAVRDSVLAAVVGVACLVVLWHWQALDALFEPWSALAGLGGALAVEWLFVAGTAVGELWERRWVQSGSVLAVLAGGMVLAVVSGPWVLAAVCWGLMTYFVLLALLLSGVWTPKTE